MATHHLRIASFALITSCVVVLYPSEGAAQTLDEFNAVVTKYSVKSPAGGPKNNPKAAVLVFFRKTKKLCWIADGKVISVDIKPTQQTDDTKQNGPTPAGEYLIGKRFTHEEHKIDWYKLYPRIEDNSGYYGYLATTKTGRFAMGLHPGSLSLGCVTVESTEMPYDKSATWKTVRNKLDSSNLVYKRDTFSGLLYVEDK